MTPKEKQEKLMEEFGIEKAKDVAETMRDYAIEFNYTEWVDYWGMVIELLKTA